MQNAHGPTTSKHSYLLLIGLILWISVYIAGCVTPKQLSYFQNDGLKEANIDVDSVYNVYKNVKISKGLILTIRVNSINEPDGTTKANPFDPIIIPAD